MRFKKGDRVYVVDRTNCDTPPGVSGVFKRFSKDSPGMCVIKRDDGRGWGDGRSKGWSVKIASLGLLSEKFDYEMDA